MRLDNGKVTFEMKEHFATEKEAQEAVEDYLKAWQIYTNMRLNYNEIRFEFEKADVIDRNPTPGVLVISSCAHAHSTTGSVKLRMTHKEYPVPPDDFTVGPDVESIWHRYEGYLNGREKLTTMAYFCFTVLKSSAGSVKEAAKKYQISELVLRKLSYLSSQVGDSVTGRKAGLKENRPHTSAEEAWMIAVIKAFIRRAGELAAQPNADLEQLTMTDFPKL